VAGCGYVILAIGQLTEHLNSLHGCGSAGGDGGNSTNMCLEMACSEVQGGGEGEYVSCQRRDLAVTLQLVARHATSKRVLGHPICTRAVRGTKRAARDRAVKLSDVHIKQLKGTSSKAGSGQPLDEGKETTEPQPVVPLLQAVSQLLHSMPTLALLSNVCCLS
jgi:hypothetical protein